MTKSTGPLILAIYVTYFTGQVAVRIEGTMNADGEIIEEGTGSLVKNRVRMYFNQLRETLLVQEAAAITAVDTYIRERLCSIRQLQEDLVAWLSQVSLWFLAESLT